MYSYFLTLLPIPNYNPHCPHTYTQHSFFIFWIVSELIFLDTPTTMAPLQMATFNYSLTHHSRCQAWLLFGVMFTSSLVKAHMQICYNPSFPSFYPKQLICTAFKLQFRHDKSHTKSRGESWLSHDLKSWSQPSIPVMTICGQAHPSSRHGTVTSSH